MTFVLSLKNLLKLRDNDSNFIGFDKYRKKGAYHWQEINTNPDYRSLIELVSQRLAPGMSVLDIGCGDGAYMGYVASRVAQATGIDADSEAVRLANREFKQRGIGNCTAKNLTIGQAVQEFRSRGQEFDLIWSMDVIEHLPDPLELIHAAIGLVAEKGIVLIGTPLFITQELVSPYHVKEYSLDEIRQIVKSVAPISSETILPFRRKDNRIYEQGYYVCTI